MFSQQSHLSVWQKQLFLCKPYCSLITKLRHSCRQIEHHVFWIARVIFKAPGVLQEYTIYWISGCQTELHENSTAIIYCTQQWHNWQPRADICTLLWTLYHYWVGFLFALSKQPSFFVAWILYDIETHSFEVEVHVDMIAMIIQFLQIIQEYFHDANFFFYHIPWVFYWIQIQWLEIPLIPLHLLSFSKNQFEMAFALSWCIMILEAIRRYATCGHEVIDIIIKQSVTYKWGLLDISGLNVFKENIPLTFTPLPAWTVGTRQVGSKVLCCWWQILTLPFVCTNQDSFIQLWWACTHSNLFANFIWCVLNITPSLLWV